jgi:apolipoprotein N-acyltransferase
MKALITNWCAMRNEQEFNSALVINNQGKVVVDYNKVHIVTGLENRFTPGKEIGLYKMQDQQFGISICKDLDFSCLYKKIWYAWFKYFNNSGMGFWN